MTYDQSTKRMCPEDAKKAGYISITVPYYVEKAGETRWLNVALSHLHAADGAIDFCLVPVGGGLEIWRRI